jgi:hypothetical protein
MKTPRFIKVCWEQLHLGWEVDVERTINILMVSPTAQGVWYVNKADSQLAQNRNITH